MFPFWEVALEPVLRAAGAKKVVEIGALNGENTVQLLAAMGDDAELHVIDPLPQFDPAEHRKRFGGRYIFHEDLSLNVLPDLPAMDLAFIDGDHNWYTVFHELRMLSEVARAAGAPLPVMLMHDVCWPYGKRDLYYAPEQIPEEWRQPYAQRGMRPGKSELAAAGGLNSQMHNALEEGGENNGVMTALDDFVEGYDKPLRVLVLPVYFGLAIVAEEELLEQNPELQAAFDQIESAEGQAAVAAMTEESRVRAAVFTHSVDAYRGRLYDHATTRYLTLIKDALVNKHYVEHEVRLAHLLECAEQSVAPDERTLRDPQRGARRSFTNLEFARDAGRSSVPTDAVPGFYPWVATGRQRLDRLHESLEQIRGGAVAGDFVDVHPGRGGTAIFLAAFVDAYQLKGPQVVVVDTFGKSPATSDPDEYLADLNIVRDGFNRFGLLNDRVAFAQGELPDAMDGAGGEHVSFLRIGAHSVEHVEQALKSLYDRVVIGGVVMIDSVLPEVFDAATNYLSSIGCIEHLERLDHEGLIWTRTVDAAEPVLHDEQEPNPRRPLLASPAPKDALDLSVIVVFYNMAREAHRTLHSLSRSYQQDLEGISYEVIAIDNGSDADQRFGHEFVSSFGKEFRFLERGEQATPSPVSALNIGLQQARGKAIAFMIDGAHVLTPGVLSLGLKGLDAYKPAIVATQQWYVGPGQQNETMLNGYEQEYEDRLFESIDWPANGYRLFEVGSFIGDRDWFDGISESNCLFAPRQLLQQVGGFDGSFEIAGGSFANLDLYERLGSDPATQIVTILGEGSFHQIHGGTTTNNGEVEQRGAQLAAYREEYKELRGRDFSGPGKPIHYVGSLYGPSKRSKARRMNSPSLFGNALQDGPDGRPSSGIPISDDLKTSFTEAYWNSMEWRDTAWLGKKVQNSPVDLVAYQSLLHEVRPEVILEIGTGGGGRAWFLASICDLLDHGEVISVGEPSPASLWEHDRISYVEADPLAADTAAEVRALVGDRRGLIIIGLGSKRRVLGAFNAFSDLVPVGSYVVFEDTIVNGNPVWTSFGAGPLSVVREVIRTDGDFFVDTSRESFSATFNSGGFLKRQR